MDAAAAAAAASSRHSHFGALTPGALGCAAAHAQAWSLAAAPGSAGPLVVFEDDVDVARWPVDLREAPEGWDLLLLGCIQLPQPA